MARKSLPPAEKPNLTPMIDVAFLILIFFMSLPMRRLDHKLTTELPPEGIQPQEPDEPPPSKVRVLVRRKAGQIHYVLGSHRATDPWKLRPVLTQLGPEHVYLIDARGDIDHQSVLALMDVLHGLEFQKIQFRGGAGITPSLRRSPRLPAPR